jgi:hypothetical protein
MQSPYRQREEHTFLMQKQCVLIDFALLHELLACEELLVERLDPGSGSLVHDIHVLKET